MDLFRIFQLRNASLSSYLLILLLGTTISSANATIPESCDCQIDTAGYASFVTTLTIADVPMQFHVHNTFAVAIGYINTNTPTVVQNLINNYPSVTTIVLLNSGGSDDDNANLQASQLLRNAGYKMYLPSNAEIASGAVDMFFSGTVRVIDIGADVGVHSWSNGTHDATFYPTGHAYHLPYINYYVNMGLTQQEAESFYYFTIHAAPAASIYWMSDMELDQYKLRTCKYTSIPTYTVSTQGDTLIADLPNATYQWLDCTNGNAPISGATNQFFTTTTTGNYAVLITEAGCADTSACYALTVTSISSLSEEESLIDIYPNPVSDLLTIDGTSATSSTLVKIIGLNGKHLFQSIIESGQLLNININYPAGIYVVELSNGQKHQFLKLIKT